MQDNERMRPVERLWSALEDRPRLRGVRQEIKDSLGSDYDLAVPFLCASGREATRYPCSSPSGPGCPRRVIKESDGSIRAVCGCTPKECDPVKLAAEDIKILRFDDSGFARTLRQQLGISGEYRSEANGDLITLGTISWVSGTRLPVVLTMAESRQHAEALTDRIERKYRQGAVLLSPTDHCIDPETEGRLIGRGFTWLVLTDLLLADSNGLIAKSKLVDVLAQRTASMPSRADGVITKDCVFRKESELVWTLSFAGQTVHLPNRSGMSYIAELLRRPRAPIEAMRLTGASVVEMQLVDRGIPLSDPQSIRQAKAVLQEKESDMARLSANDWARRGSLQHTIDALKKHLGQVQDHRGQPREVGGSADRSRTAATTAVNRARDYISEHHPALGHHLKESIQTGTSLIYAPSEVPDWQF